MSRRRQHRRSEKARRHAQQPPPGEAQVRTVVREVDYVERLAYTRSQAAQALGLSRSTFVRRVLPYLETVEMPWGAKLIPVDEVERIVVQWRRQAAQARRPSVPRGRRPTVPPEIVERIRIRRAAGESYRRIAAGFTADGIPTAHGGRQWWASTVRAIAERVADPPAGSIRARS
jgi:hypothetical protein